MAVAACKGVHKVWSGGRTLELALGPARRPFPERPAGRRGGRSMHELCASFSTIGALAPVLEHI